MNKYELWLIASDISNQCKVELIKQYNNEENIYNNINNINKNKDLAYMRSLRRLNNKNLDREEILKENLIQNDIKYVTYSSENYPENLRNIQEPPYVLFYKGNIKLINDKNMVAIVGSRRSTIYGEKVTEVIASELYEMNFGIVSGVAYGIDSKAHKSILKRGGKTIGVLGCGIDIVYPSINKSLYKEISENGLLISEFLPGTEPKAHNFPQRNRIISGLAKAVIVTEASIKSGSLITVNYALDQGKDVMVVPGPIFNSTSQGCNFLIRDGASFFLEKDDLYRFLNVTKKDNKNKEKNTIKNILLNVISSQPIHIDKIIESVNVDRIALFELLFEMQNENEIICLPGNYYAKIS